MFSGISLLSIVNTSLEKCRAKTPKESERNPRINGYKDVKGSAVIIITSIKAMVPKTKAYLDDFCNEFIYLLVVCRFYCSSNTTMFGKDFSCFFVC